MTDSAEEIRYLLKVMEILEDTGITIECLNIDTVSKKIDIVAEYDFGIPHNPEETKIEN